MNKNLKERQELLQNLSDQLISEGNKSIDNFINNRESEITERHAKQKQLYEAQKTKQGCSIAVYIQNFKNMKVTTDLIILTFFISVLIGFLSVFAFSGICFFIYAAFDILNFKLNEAGLFTISGGLFTSIFIYFFFIRQTKTLLTYEYLNYVNETKHENDKISAFRANYNNYVYQINLPDDLRLIFNRGVYGFMSYINILGQIPVSKTLLTTLSELMTQEEFKTMFIEHSSGEEQSIMLDTVLRETAKIRKIISSEEKAGCFYKN